MNWLFWKSDGPGKRLPGPKEIPQPIGAYLVTNANMPPDLVWTLKAVVSSRADEKHVTDVRVYDKNQTETRGVKVTDYHSLDGRSDLTIFDGWYNKETHAIGNRKS